MITRLLLLGATGDMAGRFLLPALTTLRASGDLDADVQVVGAGQEDWDDATFREHVAARLAAHAGDVPADARRWLLDRLRYRRMDLADPDGIARLVAVASGVRLEADVAAAADTRSSAAPQRAADTERARDTKSSADTERAADTGPSADTAPSRDTEPSSNTDTKPSARPVGVPVAVYLALPAPLFAPTLGALRRAALPPGSRVAVEKPFGDDLAGAVALNAVLETLSGGDDRAVFRVDHILGMPSVRHLERLRGSGGPLEPLWDGDHVERMEVVWEETLGLGSRIDFYDRTGAVRDVLQNHLLQVLVLAAMEPPLGPTDADLHAAKLALLRSLRGPHAGSMALRTGRARYSAGTLVVPGAPDGIAVAAYAQEPGVDPARGTETHAEVVFTVDSPRWAGTPFVLRTGKAMSADRKGVALHLRAPVTGPVPPGVARVSDTLLWIELDSPQRTAVAERSGEPVDAGPSGEPADAAPARAAAAAGPSVHAPGERSAYATVLTDVLTGGSRTSVSAEEAEEAWRVVEPVLRAWSAGAVPLREYPAGSGGPPVLDPHAGAGG